MGESKTALDLERLMHDAAISRNRATNTPEETEDFETIRSGMASRLDAIPADALSQIAKLKAELAKVTEELATAQEHIGQPLRLRVTLTKERDAARGDAEGLVVALDKTLESFREEGCQHEPDCEGCPTRNDCEITLGLDALAAYRNSRNKEAQNGTADDHLQRADENGVG